MLYPVRLTCLICTVHEWKVLAGLFVKALDSVKQRNYIYAQTSCTDAPAGPGPNDIGSPFVLESQELNPAFLFPIQFLLLIFCLPSFFVSTVFLHYWPQSSSYVAKPSFISSYSKLECVRWLDGRIRNNIASVLTTRVLAVKQRWRPAGNGDFLLSFQSLVTTVSRRSSQSNNNLNSQPLPLYYCDSRIAGLFVLHTSKGEAATTVANVHAWALACFQQDFFGTLNHGFR